MCFTCYYIWSISRSALPILDFLPHRTQQKHHSLHSPILAHHHTPLRLHKTQLEIITFLGLLPPPFTMPLYDSMPTPGLVYLSSHAFLENPWPLLGHFSSLIIDAVVPSSMPDTEPIKCSLSYVKTANDKDNPSGYYALFAKICQSHAKHPSWNSLIT